MELLGIIIILQSKNKWKKINSYNKDFIILVMYFMN